ncbi:unnamed protein product [Spirodela intermedia]|uniref:Uncharacterized protein n=2 Tax=Spirodela intermedia TaxID=51605 RepID=A0A7I8J627_SPIIN|nr:unnamed protein product [Spirodela intermedia]CAA6665215.1 unnamed protein product [Spirodela intermedia]CAA7401945.1 unnamed protein product [Spirodela intermedia]
MGRSPCCEKIGLKKGPWTPEEDQKLLAYIEEHGHGCWRSLPSKAGLQRCGKSCRLRWTNYLRPDIKRGKFSVQEEQTIIQLHALLGNRWSAIASHLPKRTDNEIKNFWNTHLKKRLAKMGIDPVTHKPRCDALSPADSHVTKASASLSHMAQWESARLEAEARLVREAKLLCFASSSAVSLGASSVSSAAAAASPFQLQLLGSDSSSSHVDLHNESAASSAPAPPPCFDVLRAWQDIWRRGSTRGRGEGQSSRDGKIDLESPTSTLTFSEAVIPEGAMGLGSQHNSSSIAYRCGGEGDVEEEEEVDWKCFPKPMQLFFGSRERTTDGFAAATFPVDSSPLFGTDSVASWLHESVKIGSGSTAASTIAHFGDGFTEMLLNNADEHSSPEDAGGCTHELADAGKPNSENEESRSYWNGIFNLVTSSSASNSSDCVLV